MKRPHLPTHPIRRPIPLLAAVAVAAVAVHLGLADYALTHWRWSATALGIAGLAAVAKLLLMLGYRTVRTRRR
ncbi:hypothetical protein [Nocardia alni]|uniref:hypothetical protein n=1 Tax=Nocardia alni TaxID=2815723 RepID=UPI001C24CAF0|nr:hypothetical protein [Nocardia alni]